MGYINGLKKGDKVATREAYGRGLCELGADHDFAVLDADLAEATKTCYFAKAFPDRFFDCGIAEGNMIGVAAGLAAAGKPVFASSFAMFAAGRAFEQIRNSVAYPHLNVKIAATHAGITVGEDGATHQCLEDIALMRVTEVFAAIPFLPFAMILSSIMSHMPWSENAKIFLLMCILGVLSWTGLARLVRGQVLVARENEYVTAAKAMGVKESKIAFKHILPNVISIIIVTLTLDFATCMLTESSLSYLGFGVTPPRPTWGNMLNGANNMTVMNNYWWQWLFTALFLAVTTICINIIGDALRDVMDPKSNAER